MNANLAKCDSCEALNDKAETNWVQIAGVVWNGINDPKDPYARRQVTLDLCGKCAKEVTANKLVDLVPTLPTPQAIPLKTAPTTPAPATPK